MHDPHMAKEALMGALANAKEVNEQIKKVRQARQYKPDAVPDEIVQELLDIARWTGSARNTQPWQFIVIKDKERLRQISQIRTPINWVADAPLAIAIVLDGAAPLSEAYDEGRLAERMFIAAQVLGLGGGVAWFGDESQQAQGKQVLGIPDNLIARGVVVIGYPSSIFDPRPGRVAGGRKPLSETVSYERFGQNRA
jgi:nitroreductase